MPFLILQVEYLPIVLPQEKKHETVAQFAQRVRISNKLVKQNSHITFFLNNFLIV